MCTVAIVVFVALVVEIVHQDTEIKVKYYYYCDFFLTQ